MADVISTTVRSFRERSSVFEIKKDGRVKTGGVGGLDRVIAAAGRGLMGFEDSGVTPRNLTLRLLRTMKPPHRLREAFRLEEYVARKGFLPWRLRLLNLNWRIAFEIEGKGHGHNCLRITTILTESFSKGHGTRLRRFYRRIDRGKV